ncbi:ATP-binding cassette domain-containing protein [Nocardia uniformis]|uniref:ATP-binding cassette domain-containing protein n=1 Tax=Nocardia uniformis TaxID=53432 RepID=A0A849BXC5_9NOCA|nr:nitrate/sulfonate/bicarbonate ABC transporter ATP-binding protein [Nocardia uniformis]NNH68765.1 ATP-binding cassette domain-containing protein [Nocardia uniformis]
MTHTTTGDVLLEIDGVGMSFTAADGEQLHVLDHIDLTLRDGEIVALLGRSGSGKSTLLRLVAGLIAPTTGQIRYRGTPLRATNPGAAMVFQSFALMPWLTVQDNVELGLAARGVPPVRRRELALDAIDRIGLDGFESAYPKELSGGMRQRVGFARALVLEPDLLLMDEPFSALDVLTAENLRTELVNLWATTDFPTRCVCIVTHNIEEAVQLADRVVVLGANPGHILADVPVTPPRPRDRRAPGFAALVDHLYGLLTGRAGEPGAALPDPGTPVTTPLPDASVGGLAGLVELVHGSGDRVDLPGIAGELNFELDDLLPLVDAAALLGFLTTESGDVLLTEVGARFATADIQDSKRIFATQARKRAPLVRTICSALAGSSDHSARADFVVDLLRRSFSPADAQQQLATAIDWGRYGELYDYDTDSGRIAADPAAGL